MFPFVACTVKILCRLSLVLAYLKKYIYHVAVVVFILGINTEVQEVSLFIKIEQNCDMSSYVDFEREVDMSNGLLCFRVVTSGRLL